METAMTNPANLPNKTTVERTRIPMSLPSLKLAVPDIPGYHLHWMRGEPGRIQQALKGGYIHVELDEVDLNAVGVADSQDAHGSTDLGSQVSVIGGSDGIRMYLMKIKEEFWETDETARARQQEGIAGKIRGDRGLQGPGDNSNRYTPEGSPNRNIFQPKRRT